jgi:NRPS condensation-like uncharacterized protein
MKRKLLFAERMLYGDGKKPFNIVLPVNIKGSFTIEGLNNALKKLQQKHPLLNACVENDADNMPWFVVKRDGDQIPVRVVKRIDDNDWKEITLTELVKPFDPSIGPLMRLVWIKGETYSNFLLVFHHCFCDGESVLNILAEMLQLLDNTAADIGASYPLLYLEDIIPSEILSSRKKILKSKLIGGIAALFFWLIPIKKREIIRGTDYLINWKLDKELSRQLILKCKAANITVNTALCAAVLNAFKEVKKENFHNKISCPVNIRQFAPQIKKDQIFAFGLMFVTSLGKLADFFSDAKRMQLEINDKTKNLDPYSTMMMMEEAHSSLNNFTDFLKYSKSSNDCMFSNLGKITIPHQYQSFTVETIYSPSVIGPLGNTTTLVTSTYQEAMDFTFIGSEAYLAYDEALAIKNKVVSILSTIASHE